MPRLTPADIKLRKNATPIVVLTAYTAPVARILDAHVDILLVGDSLGMTLYGMKDTLGVSVEMMINHGRAVVNSTQTALVVVDMPFGSYENSSAQAVESAKRIIAETGAGAVKLEGGRDRAAQIRAIVECGIAVMGHVGLLPQRAEEFGGFKTQGKTPESADAILADALAVEEAGAFSVVIEATVEAVARRVSQAVSIPTIGIGASPSCDGQVLVIDDILGLSGYIPSFAKIYGDGVALIDKAASDYANEVRQRIFPGSEFVFGKKKSTPE